jgi:hypothetical protein
MSVLQVDEGWDCEFRDRGMRVSMRVVDSGGALVVSRIEVQADDDPGGISPSGLSRAPYATWMRAAKDAVGREGRRRSLLRPSDIALRPYLEDRRGAAPRTEADLAHLAEVYVLSGESRRGLARVLAARHGGSQQTWSNRLSQAKRFIRLTVRFDEDGGIREVPVLTDEAMKLIYGDDYASAFAHQDAQDQELEEAMHFIRRHEAPKDSTERDLAQFERRRNGEQVMTRRLAAARRVIETYGQNRY